MRQLSMIACEGNIRISCNVLFGSLRDRVSIAGQLAVFVLTVMNRSIVND